MRELQQQGTSLLTLANLILPVYSILIASPPPLLPASLAGVGVHPPCICLVQMKILLGYSVPLTGKFGNCTPEISNNFVDTDLESMANFVLIYGPPS